MNSKGQIAYIGYSAYNTNKEGVEDAMKTVEALKKYFNHDTGRKKIT